MKNTLLTFANGIAAGIAGAAIVLLIGAILGASLDTLMNGLQSEFLQHSHSVLMASATDAGVLAVGFMCVAVMLIGAAK